MSRQARCNPEAYEASRISTDREWHVRDYGNDEIEPDPDEDNLQASIDNGFYDDPEPAA